MIATHKQKKAIQAIHDLMIEARVFAAEERSHEQLFRFFDHLEYLPALMLEEKDQTIFFEEYLEGICLEFNCMRAIKGYRLP